MEHDGLRISTTSRGSLANDAGLDPAFAEKFLTFLMTEVVRHHRSIAETRTHSRGGSPH
jgi:chorismate mutase